MAKSLGQIHTVNFSRIGINTTGQLITCDLAGALTEQLQRLIRCGNYFKLVGIDMSLDTQGTTGGGQVTGFFRYFSPTRGRCEAFKGAYRAMKQQMQNQGINMHDNKMYDFRTPLNNTALSGFTNQATLDGTNPLCLIHTTVDGASVFGVHNRSQQPQYTGAAGDMYQPGFDTLLQTTAGTDFVLNDTIPYSGDHNFASEDYETIPFMMTWTPDSTDLAVDFQWRPDPALYLAILAGQLQCVIEEVELDGGAPGVNINIAMHVSGWKSIMGNPDKKRRKSSTRRSSKKKSRGHKK